MIDISALYFVFDPPVPHIMVLSLTGHRSASEMYFTNGEIFSKKLAELFHQDKEKLKIQTSTLL